MVLGPRFLIQAGFIIAVAVVAGIERFGTWTIILLVAGAWLIVAAVELGLWARNTKGRGQTPAGSDPAPEPEPLVLQPEPPPMPVPPLTAAPPPPPEPEPEPEPEPDPVVTYLPTNDGPREWNLWELERLAREHTSDDVARNEERSYLLMYLREFAGPDGNLPRDFDSLVRDAFGDLLRVGAT